MGGAEAMHDYPGNPFYWPSITLPDDGDIDAAHAYARGMAQLADRTEVLRVGGTGFDFTDTIFHGATIFADGSFSVTTETVDIYASTITNVTAATKVALSSATITAQATAGLMSLSASQSISLGAATFIALNATGSLGGSVGNIGFNVVSFIDINATGGITLDGSSINLNTGMLLISGPTISIGGDSASHVVQFDVATINLYNAHLTGTGLVSFAGPGATEIKTLRQSCATHGDGDFAIDGTGAYEHIITGNASVMRGISLSHTGAALGQRIRFNAQKVLAGPNYYLLGYGAKQWHLWNTAGKTAVVEFVSDGAGWVVDYWEAGGVALRNG